jgi:hypothetical protein
LAALALSLLHIGFEKWDDAGQISRSPSTSVTYRLIEGPDGKLTDVMGRSRGGYIAFLVAQQHPDLL